VTAKTYRSTKEVQRVDSGRRSAISRLVFKVIVFCAALLTLNTTHLIAQINTATLSGNVVDSSGAVVPEASVVVTETSTGSKRTAQSSGEGLFTIPLLQPGVYNVIVSKSGFATTKQNNIELQINQSASLVFTLKVGSSETTVQVNGTQPLLDTQNSSLGTVVSPKEILDLPLNGRQFTQLLQLAPGTVPIDVSQNSTSRPDLGGGGVTPAINGQTNRSNLFYIDGIYATDPFFSGYSISPSIDAIQEFQEQTHADQAEFGQSTGGTISVATKSGTNQFHGSAYEFFRNDDLDALSYFQTTREGYHQNQFGGTFGGPVLRNKLFFFGLYDGYRQTQAATNFATLPTAAELGGDFSALLPNTIIYDPTTYNPATGTTQPFPGNIIPQQDLNQGVITALKAYLPSTLPTSTGANNYVNTASNVLDQDQYGVRVDYNIGAHDLLFGRFTISNESQTSPRQLPTNPFVTGFNGQNDGINWTHTFSPTLIAQVTAGYNYLDFPQQFLQPNAGSVFTQAGFGAGFTDQPGGVEVPAIPGLHPSGFFDLNSGWGPIGPQHTGQFSGSITKQAGSHALKFGASNYINGMYTNWAENDVYFNQQATWNPATSSGGNSIASTVLGLPDSSGRQLGNSGVSLRSHLFGLFAQDSWKISPKLTVNYGLRWDYTSPVSDIHNRLSGFDIRSNNWYIAKGDINTPTYSLPAGVVILPRNTITSPDYKNFSPRFGFSYALLPKTVIRAGAGVTFDNWSGALQAAQNARGAWPSGASQNVNNANIAGVTPGVTAQNPFGTMAPLLPTTPFPSGGGFLDTAWKDAYSWQWNLQVQQQLGGSGVFSLGYVGSSTSRAPIQVPFNVSTQLGPTQVIPYSNMSQFNMLQSIGHMNYNALQTKYEKRFQGGLSVITAFTWSKTINVGCAEYWEACDIQDPYNLAPDRSASNTDVPVIFTFSSVYELPFGKGKQFVQQGPAAQIFGGWQVNGILATRDGTPYTATINFDNANANGGSQRPNQVGDPNNGPHNVKEYFNTAAFAVAPKYTYGDVHRNSLRGPGYTDADFSLFRNFDLYEKAMLQFRAEFFNIFNHPNFSNPDAGLEDSTYGQITSITGNPRELQFAFKATF
jgi:hypothetical protein